MHPAQGSRSQCPNASTHARSFDLMHRRPLIAIYQTGQGGALLGSFPPLPPVSRSGGGVMCPLLSAVTRWERRLVALLRATVHPLDGETDSWTEFGRDIDTVAQKVESFTGRVEEAGPARIVAAFGLDPVEDAAGRAALAAMAIQNALRRARPPPARRAAVTLAIHADECLVGDVSGRARIDVEAYRRMATVLEDLGGRTESDTAFVSPTVRSLL